MTHGKTNTPHPIAASRPHPLVTPSRLEREAIIYIRQSTSAQVEENWGSTTVQREQGKLALEYGWAEAAIRIIDEDLGRSGSSTQERTGWQEMLRRIAARQVGAIFASNAARLARQLRDFEELRVLCLYHDTLLVIDGRPVDADDPNDVAMTQVKATFAQLENKTRTDAMKRARMAKAHRGHAVSRLPVGWVKRPDGKYDFDPEAQAVIAELFARFWEAGSVRALVRMLDREGKQLPAQHGRQLIWKRPNHQAVRFILRNAAYAGQYIYGRSMSRPDLGQRANGHSRRALTTPDRWVVIEGHHPAYVAAAEQQRIRERLADNRFPSGPGRGAALLQGLAACARCRHAMSALYKKHGHRYQCDFESANYGGKHCTSVSGRDLDAAVERIVLKELQAPAVEVLRKALADAHVAESRRLETIDATRQRLEYAARIARERYEQCDPRNRLVAGHLEHALEESLQARCDFERQLAAQPPAPPIDGSEKELEALIRITADVPALWRHARVTPRDRKELLRCVIERVLITRDDYRINGTIVWRSGARTSFFLHRRAGVYEVIRRLHAEGRTVREIQGWLATGDPETGQRWEFVKNHVHVILGKLGVRAHQRRAFTPELLAEVHCLRSQGLRMRAIAEQLNAVGSTTPMGRQWTKESVRNALKPPEKRFGRRRRHQSDPQTMQKIETEAPGSIAATAT